MSSDLNLPTWIGDALKGVAVGSVIFLGLALLAGGSFLLLGGF